MSKTLTPGRIILLSLLSPLMISCGDPGSVNRYSGKIPNPNLDKPKDSDAATTTYLTASTAFALGSMHSCAISTAGALSCWGRNTWGQLAQTSVPESTTAMAVADFAASVTGIALGERHTCAIKSGKVSCWGSNASYQLGTKAVAFTTTPTAVADLSTETVTAIAAGTNHNCVIASGAAKCWGNNAGGQLGNGLKTTTERVQNVTGLDSGVTGIGTGQFHSCALIGDAVKCWGSNIHSQLGTATTATTPVTPTGLGSGVSSITVGSYHACALLAGGTVKCWGRNDHGQAGTGSRVNVTEPTEVIGLTGATAIAAGGEHTCAVIAAGKVKCWGRNTSGQLGAYIVGDALAPVAVLGAVPATDPELSGVDALAAGTNHTCAHVTTGDKLFCWGQNASEQLGDGTGESIDSYTPVQVRTE